MQIERWNLEFRIWNLGPAKIPNSKFQIPFFITFEV